MWSKRHYWWMCDCGVVLPPAPEQNQGRGLVQCRCGDWWRFDYYSLNRWPGDSGSTGLEPHRAMMYRK